MFARKLLRFTSLVVIALSIILFLVSLYNFMHSTVNMVAVDHGGIVGTWTLLMLFGAPVIRVLCGIIGLIGRGRKLLLISGIVLLVFSITPIFSSKGIVFYVSIGLAAFAVIYILGALLYKAKVDDIEEDKHKKLQRSKREEIRLREDRIEEIEGDKSELIPENIETESNTVPDELSDSEDELNAPEDDR